MVNYKKRAEVQREREQEALRLYESAKAGAIPITRDVIAKLRATNNNNLANELLAIHTGKKVKTKEEYKRALINEQNRERRERLKAEGLCYVCGRERAMSPGKVCHSCYMRKIGQRAEEAMREGRPYHPMGPRPDSTRRKIPKPKPKPSMPVQYFDPRIMEPQPQPLPVRVRQNPVLKNNLKKSPNLHNANLSTVAQALRSSYTERVVYDQLSLRQVAIKIYGDGVYVNEELRRHLIKLLKQLQQDGYIRIINRGSHDKYVWRRI